MVLFYVLSVSVQDVDGWHFTGIMIPTSRCSAFCVNLQPSVSEEQTESFLLTN